VSPATKHSFSRHLAGVQHRSIVKGVGIQLNGARSIHYGIRVGRDNISSISTMSIDILLPLWLSGECHSGLAYSRDLDRTLTDPIRVRGLWFYLASSPGVPNSLFGQSTSTLASYLGSGGQGGGLNPLYQIGEPRSIRLALKLQF
jgi:hypothetical protein